MNQEPSLGIDRGTLAAGRTIATTSTIGTTALAVILLTEHIYRERFKTTQGAASAFRLPLGCQLGCQTTACPDGQVSGTMPGLAFLVEARRIELPNLLHAMQALYQLSYAPRCTTHHS